MSQRLWLLVEWVDERSVFSHYGVVSADSLVTSESDLHTGKLVFIRNKHGNGARRAQIMRISDNKSYVKELKVLLERQDQQVKNVVSLCMNTIKEMKSGPLYLGAQNTIQQSAPTPSVSGTPQHAGNGSDATSESDQETNELSFNKSAKPNNQYKSAGNSMAVYNNRSGTQSKFYGRRSMCSSTPLPGRHVEDSCKLTFDQSTQTDAAMLQPPLPKIEEMETVLHRLYRQFLSLISEVHVDDAMSILSEVSELERYVPENTVNESPILKDETPTEPKVNTTNSGIEDKLVLKSHPKVLHVRRASAHTTISGEPVENNVDMVPIGSGNVLVPTRLLADLDWTSYTTATRQLLQAVFPRRVLATHCLSGKQSPAFANKPPKKRLDPKLVDDIIDTVSERCGVHKRLLDEIDPPVVGQPEEEEEELSYPMSYEEMLEHRQQIAKLRAQESYKAAKAKRQSKIKSKKYHRILKKDKLKQQLKEFEELQSKNPEEALKKLETLEKARALERHTLRHKNTGKWAKSKLIRAKYDTEVRQQLSEQLAVSKSLTHKTMDAESSDDDVDNNETISDLALSQDPKNPWMMKRPDKSNIDEEFDFGYKKYLKTKMLRTNEVNDSGSDHDNVEEDNSNITENVIDVLKKSVNKLSQRNNAGRETNTKITKNLKIKEPVTKKIKISNDKKQQQQKESKLVATSNWIVDPVNGNQGEEKKKPSEDISNMFDCLEKKVVGKVQKKIKKLKKNIDKIDNASKSAGKVKLNASYEEKHGLEYLKLKKLNQKPIIDEPLLETSSKSNVTVDPKTLSTVIAAMYSTEESPRQENTNIDPSRFIEIKPKYLNTPLPKEVNEYDNLDDDEQVVPKIDIEEVFEEDDVVASFRQEKEDEINKNKPQDIDLSLPGWGQWGGKGVKVSKRKRNRFIMKAPTAAPRRDENKGNIIIKEYKDPKLASHKVSDVPFPFNSIKDYEASIRVPLGNTFMPEKAHKKLIQPSVKTKAGAIIEPMDEEELLMPRNRTFNNESVIKLLAKK
ncbi:unnamed protein product, partial [Iphiclides podalirius]